MRRLSDQAKALRKRTYYMKVRRWKAIVDRIRRHPEYEARVRERLMLLAHVACNEENMCPYISCAHTDHNK